MGKERRGEMVVEEMVVRGKAYKRHSVRQRRNLICGRAHHSIFVHELRRRRPWSEMFSVVTLIVVRDTCRPAVKL